MAFEDLLSLLERSPCPISRNTVRDRVAELTGVTPITVFKTSLDTNVCRGFFLHASNTEHQFVRQAGTHVIALARGMNRCWDRLVYVKELMHCFDEANSATDSGGVFESLLADFSITSRSAMTPAMRSEVCSFWRALAVLCPKSDREIQLGRLRSNEIDEYAVALHFRIPQLYVNALSEDVESIASSLT